MITEDIILHISVLWMIVCPRYQIHFVCATTEFFTDQCRCYFSRPLVELDPSACHSGMLMSIGNKIAPEHHRIATITIQHIPQEPQF